jgi:hypothetical protein
LTAHGKPPGDRTWHVNGAPGGDRKHRAADPGAVSIRGNTDYGGGEATQDMCRSVLRPGPGTPRLLLARVFAAAPVPPSLLGTDMS